MYPPANGRGEELIAPNDSGRHGAVSAGTRDGHSGHWDVFGATSYARTFYPY